MRADWITEYFDKFDDTNLKKFFDYYLTVLNYTSYQIYHDEVAREEVFYKYVLRTQSSKSWEEVERKVLKDKDRFASVGRFKKYLKNRIIWGIRTAWREEYEVKEDKTKSPRTLEEDAKLTVNLKKKHPSYDDDGEIILVSTDQSPDLDPILFRAAQENFSSLKWEKQKLLSLRYSGWSGEDIQEELGISKNTVTKWDQQAHDELFDKLNCRGKEIDDEEKKLYEAFIESIARNWKANK